jgi:putative SOS response-associated peptidase YedK
MCGRVRLSTDHSEIRLQLDLADFAPAPNWRPSWNIAPTQDIYAVVHEREPAGRVPRIMRWGLIPAWAKEEKQRYATFNAKAETVASAATFRVAWRAGRRCLVVTDGFYEWRRSDRQPFLIARSSGELTILAGLWETWRSPAGETIRSCTVLTTTPNDAMARLHDRMPVILARDDWPTWLGETPANDAAVAALLGPCPSEALTLVPVDRRVGNVKNDAGLGEPVVLADGIP